MSKETRRDIRRRLEQFVANPRCEANVLSAVHDVPMRDVAVEDGVTPRGGQSRFAIASGVTFENALYADGAARLHEALVRAGVLPAEHDPAADLRLRAHGGPMRDLDHAAATFASFLRRVARSGAARPSVVIAPAMALPGAAPLPDGMLAADLVTAHPSGGRVELRIGEVKAWPDRGGHTDRDKLASARAQAGLYVYALRRLVDALGLAATVRVSDRGFLVLRSARWMGPLVRPDEDLAFQARRGEDALRRLREASAANVPADDGSEESRATRLAAVREAPTAWAPECMTFCDRAAHCQRAAIAEGDPSVLGDEAARFVGAVPLERVRGILSGAERPATDAEEDLARRIQAARECSERAVLG